MKTLLLLFAVIYQYFSLSLHHFSHLPYPQSAAHPNFLFYFQNYIPPRNSLVTLQALLSKETDLSRDLADKVIQAFQCADKYHVAHNDIVTVIDYSLPSNQKRIWVFDLAQKKRLFHTYVSHGINSGSKETRYFSNKFNSKSSSLGIYTTLNTYHGRDGLSLRLAGLEKGFNNNAESRYIVMHGSWYVQEDFIKKYGRAGRSWGCPALPLALVDPVLNTIKDNAFLVIYYPEEKWIAKSQYLNCQQFSLKPSNLRALLPTDPPLADNTRETVFFLDENKNNNHDDLEPVVALSTDQYRVQFDKPFPLDRMLRRQIEDKEYIALSTKELEQITKNPALLVEGFVLVLPSVKSSRGYFKTEMGLLKLGKIKSIQAEIGSQNYEIATEAKTFTAKPTSAFIRWLGL